MIFNSTPPIYLRRCKTSLVGPRARDWLSRGRRFDCGKNCKNWELISKFEHKKLPAKLLDCVLRSNKSSIKIIRIDPISRSLIMIVSWRCLSTSCGCSATHNICQAYQKKSTVIICNTLLTYFALIVLSWIQKKQRSNLPSWDQVLHLYTIVCFFRVYALLKIDFLSTFADKQSSLQVYSDFIGMSTMHSTEITLPIYSTEITVS